jgi:co-chaperonin GroES (HSP10)
VANVIIHLCSRPPTLNIERPVISMGPGREEENGRIAPMPNIKPGDVVIAKNPWGIGPKDEETPDGRKLSFMRSQDIAAVVEGKLLEEDS